MEPGLPTTLLGATTTERDASIPPVAAPLAQTVTDVPDIRIRVLDERPVRRDGAFVLYWMTATRRLHWSYALDRALGHATALGKPLLILEAIECDYPWASDRHHAAILDGMREHDAALEDGPVGYHPYVEPEPGAGAGLVAALAGRACVLVTDDSPVFFTPQLMKAAATIGACRVEAVDSCGLLPLAAAGRSFGAAYHLRRFLQKSLAEHLLAPPRPDPLERAELPRLDPLPDSVLRRWPRASRAMLEDRGRLARLPIDHAVEPTGRRYGHAAGRRRLESFLDSGLSRYAELRNDPDADAASGLSPWLHYGQLSSHEILDAVGEREGWSLQRISDHADGRRSGWWGMTDGAEAFLDQLVTWRELGYLYCRYEQDFASYESLPEWARETLEAHATDPRERVYTLDELAGAETGDELWNAAQRQLLRDGVIQNYLRMLWGKKILEWTRDPREALDRMIELNNRYAADGRDPNSYSGIFWVLGRFDRGWPERPIFGKVRSMTSASARRKLDLDGYLARWGDPSSLDLG